MTHPIPIILFKTPSPSSSLDPYSITLASTSYHPTFIPVLEETYHVSDLLPILESGPSKWEGVIITSRRGAEGWIRGVREFTLGDRKGKSKATSEGGWNEIPLYTVGTASSDHLLESDIPKDYIPRILKFKTEPPKSAIHLIPHIINTPSISKGYRPYLFVRGDKSTELLQDELKEAGRDIKEILVYRTSPRNDILDNLNLFRNDEGLGKKKKRGWFGFFSPSGAEVVLPLLRRHSQHINGLSSENEKVDGNFISTEKGLNLSEVNGIEEYWKGWKVFVIGETTKRYLEEKGIKVDAVADKPNPEGLLEAIMNHDQEQLD